LVADERRVEGGGPTSEKSRPNTIFVESFVAFLSGQRWALPPNGAGEEVARMFLESGSRPDISLEVADKQTRERENTGT